MTDNAKYPQTPYPSRAEIEWHIANGRRLRAAAMAAALAKTGGWIRRGAAAFVHQISNRVRNGNADPDAATRLRSPLAAIRSAAEILRDHPEMAASDRARFVDILLAEEQRLERLVSSLIADGGGRLASRQDPCWTCQGGAPDPARRRTACSGEHCRAQLRRARGTATTWCTCLDARSGDGLSVGPHC